MTILLMFMYESVTVMYLFTNCDICGEDKWKIQTSQCLDGSYLTC